MLGCVLCGILIILLKLKEVVNLLMKMRILLSFICCNDDFLINEFKCAWGFDEGFWQIEWWCFSDVSGFV